MRELVVPILFAWIAAAVLFFRRLPPRQAVLVLFVAGLLLLPEVTSPKANPADGPEPLAFPAFKLTKINAIAYAFLLGSLLCDHRRWRSLRLSPLDLPVSVFCLCPLASSLANDLSLYDGLSESLWQTLAWGVPYLAGRLYLADSDGLRAAVLAIVIGAILYVPVCWLEIVMSPQLHYRIYGFSPSPFLQVLRFGGYRPMGLTTHGLVLGLWMCLGTMLAVWCLATGALEEWRQRLRMPPWMVGALVLLLAITAVFVKSTGAIVLGAGGLLLLGLLRRYRLPLLAVALLVAAPAYVVVRAGGFWSGEGLVTWLGQNFDADRAQSLDFRLRNEDELIDKALQRPVFGWGGWGRSRLHDKTGADASVTDGLWIIALGTHGLVGLVAVMALFLLPALKWFLVHPPHVSARARPVETAIVVLLPLVMIDNLFNALGNPVYLLLVGGLTGTLLRERSRPALSANPVNSIRPLGR